MQLYFKQKLLLSVLMNVERAYNKENDYMNSDNRATLMVCAGHGYNFKKAWECHYALKALAESNKIILPWCWKEMRKLISVLEEVLRENQWCK